MFFCLRSPRTCFQEIFCNSKGCNSGQIPGESRLQAGGEVRSKIYDFTIKNNPQVRTGNEIAMLFIMLNIQNVSNSYQPDEKLSFCHSTFQTVRISNTLNLVWMYKIWNDDIWYYEWKWIIEGEERDEKYFSASFRLLWKIDGGLYFLFNKSKLRQININHQTLIRKTGVNSEILKSWGKLSCRRIEVAFSYENELNYFGFIKKIFCLSFHLEFKVLRQQQCLLYKNRFVFQISTVGPVLSPHWPGQC